MPSRHAHPVDPSAVSDARRTALPRADAQFLVGRLHLLCEPTRLRTLDVLQRVRELCVGDLALALDVSEDAAGYALRQLRTAGFVEARRDGRVVFYALSERFPRTLLNECVVRLGELSRGGPASGAEESSP